MADYKHQRAEGPATVFAIGKATPPTAYPQSEYADFYFDITNSNDKIALKAKFARICKNSGINQRYFHCTEEVLKANPSMCTYKDSSLDVRQAIAVKVVPRLAAKAAEQALKEWGRPREQISHLVFATSCGVNMPGADLSLTRLLGLDPTVKRAMFYQQGCLGGGIALRVAKDLAENNKGARVLTVVSELNCVTFRAPSEEHGILVGSATAGDGASVLIIGSDPVQKVERPLYEIHWAGETILPESDGAIQAHLTQAGLMYHLMKDVPGIISRHILPILNVAAAQMTGSPGWNDIFWCVHPGGRAILDELEKALNLKPEKLRATRDVLYNYGNMLGATVLFVLDQMRNLSAQKNSTTTGESAEWGILVAYGAGLTVEVSVLKAIPTPSV